MKRLYSSIDTLPCLAKQPQRASASSVATQSARKCNVDWPGPQGAFEAGFQLFWTLHRMPEWLR